MSLPAITGCIRERRQTPAFTIAAGCKKTDTRAGAAVAFGRQKWNGTCTGFVNAPGS